MRMLIGILLVMLAVLQYRLWVGDGSFAEVSSLRRDIREQRAEIERMKRRNHALEAQVQDLRRGLDAVEDLARSELGMIRDGEIFYQIPESPRKPAP